MEFVHSGDVLKIGSRFFTWSGLDSAIRLHSAVICPWIPHISHLGWIAATVVVGLTVKVSTFYAKASILAFIWSRLLTSYITPFVSFLSIGTHSVPR